jgi:hypothetical protein
MSAVAAVAQPQAWLLQRERVGVAEQLEQAQVQQELVEEQRQLLELARAQREQQQPERWASFALLELRLP